MTGPRNRRTFLRLGGALALPPLAGCATLEADLGLRTERLGRVILANSIDERVTVDVDVKRNGTTVYESSHRLAPGSSEERPQVVLEDWQADPEARSWEIRAKTPTSDWRAAEIDAAVGDRDGCHDVTVVTGDWPETPVLVLLGDCANP